MPLINAAGTIAETAIKSTSATVEKFGHTMEGIKEISDKLSELNSPRDYLYSKIEEIKSLTPEQIEVNPEVDEHVAYNTDTDNERLMNEAKTLMTSQGLDINDEEAVNAEFERLVASEGLRNSYAGKIGTFIEPILKPLGFDWRIGIGLVAGGAAKEVFVSTIAQIKSIEDGDESVLTESLRNDPVFNPIVAYTLLLFVLLYFPCFAAVGVIGSEIGKKWIPFLMIYTLAVAWIVSFIFYQVAGRIAGII